MMLTLYRPSCRICGIYEVLVMNIEPCSHRESMQHCDRVFAQSVSRRQTNILSRDTGNWRWIKYQQDMPDPIVDRVVTATTAQDLMEQWSKCCAFTITVRIRGTDMVVNTEDQIFAEFWKRSLNPRHNELHPE